MGRWIDYEIQRGFTDWSDLADAHNADCDAYKATIEALSKTCSELESDREYNAGLVAERDKRIAELEEKKSYWKKVAKYEFKQACLNQVFSSQRLTEIVRLKIENLSLRHTAKQIADFVADGMDPDVEGVPAQYHDAAMQRIAALDAELARVKAESLRVVADGDAVELDKIQRHQYIQWDGHVCVSDKLRCDLVRITDNHRYDVRQQYCDSFRFPPVCLKRWEDTDVLRD